MVRFKYTIKDHEGLKTFYKDVPEENAERAKQEWERGAKNLGLTMEKCCGSCACSKPKDLNNL